MHVKGNGGKKRAVPIEAEPLSVIEPQLDSRAIRFPGMAKRKANAAASYCAHWPARSPCSSGVTANR